MNYNFDEIIERRHTNSLKYDFAAERGKPEGLLPLWVADMDFKTAPCVTQTLIESANHAIFGYTEVKGDYFHAVKNWFVSGFDFEIERKWLIKTPGIMYAICMAIRGFTKVGDSVLIQQPVYYPFMESVLSNDRNLVVNSLVYENGGYQIDFADFEQKIVENQVKLFALCSPHNPVGRVWTKDELQKMGNICMKHHVLVVSDEIHCDFIYNGYKHFIFSSLSQEFLENSIICTSPSKTFNLAGLQISNNFIASPTIRHKFKAEIVKTGYSQLNTMGLVACQSAYENGKDWFLALMKYLTENLAFTRDFVKEHLPQIKMIDPQGTYLIWLDFSALSLSMQELDDLMVKKAKLWIDHGTMFGPEGEGFIRINIACPRKLLQTALERIRDAVQ
ncbi:pyridoxal phosphate-dependent aminotransferase [Lachnospiraceae bacterium ZAX-1]